MTSKSYAPDAQAFQTSIRAPQAAGVDHKADTLMQVLNIGTTAAKGIFDNVEEERYNHAYQVATQGGALDEKLLKKSLAYQRGAAVATARRRFIEDEAELSDLYETKFDKATGTAEDLNKFIDGFLHERYGNIDDKEVAKALVPQMGKLREDMMTRYTTEVRETVKQDMQTNYAVIAADELEKTGSLDVAKLHSEMLPTIGGKDTNAVLATIVANEAVSRGKPELLDAVPDRWADGTPTFKRSPQFDDYLRNSRQAAENQQAHVRQLLDTEERKQRLAAKQHAEDELTNAVLNRQDITAQTSKLLTSGVIDGETARTLVGFQESFSKQREGHAANFGAIASLESSIYAGKAAQADVMSAYSQGYFGYGESAQKEVSRLLSIANSSRAQNSELFGNPAYRTYFDELSSIYQARKDILGNPDPVSAQLEREAIRTYREKVIDGTSPLKARNEVLESIKPTSVQMPTTRLAPQDAVAALKAQRLSPAQFAASGITAKQLRELDLDPETRDLAVSALEAARGLR